MANTRAFGLIDWILLLVVLLVAGAVRAGYLVFLAANATTTGPLQVQDPPAVIGDDPLFAGVAEQKPASNNELDGLIVNVKESTWFGGSAPFAKEEELTAHYSPGYPWLIGLLAKVLPADYALNTTLRWIQCSLGTLTAGIYFLFARRAFSSRFVALLTGLFCACYPFWVISTAEINDGVLASFLLGICLWFGTRAIQVNGAFTSLLYGLGLAGLSLVRAATLPFTFIALAWFLFRSRKESRGWLCALLAFLGFANGLAPWTVRNFQKFEEPVPLVSSTWLHLWIGNNAQATGGPATKAMLGGAPTKELQNEKKQPRRYAMLGSEVLNEVRSHPVKTVQRRVAAWSDFWVGERFWTEKELTRELPQYKLTEQSFSALTEAKVPAAVVDKLKSLKDKTLDKDAFVEAYGKSLDDKGERERYQDDVLDRARVELPPVNVELILELSLFGVLLFALLGWRWTYAFRKDAMPSSLALIWIPLPYILGHAEALHSPRLPLDGVLICYAAFALACLIPGLGGSLREGRKPEEPEAE